MIQVPQGQSPSKALGPALPASSGFGAPGAPGRAAASTLGSQSASVSTGPAFPWLFSLSLIRLLVIGFKALQGDLVSGFLT